ncbi:Structural maintenance of chromosomes protein 6 [Saitoella coloradoensis]
MARLAKRRREDVEDNDSDASAVSSLSGSKRRQTESASARDEDSDGEDEAGVRSVEETTLSDEGDEDEAEVQQGVLEHTQRERAAPRRTGGAEAGVIKKVQLINFMCHSYLEVPLGPQINFIIGHNGSGKSAVLTAITVCLGGKATATNRGSSMKNLIKEGETTAQVTVTLLNRGEDAYRHEDYGDEIVVVRRFSRDGASSYKIQSQNGRTISSKREELEEISDFMGLQIDNPMNVLTQDTARQFLSTSSPHEKYVLFMKGVELSQLDRDYTVISESLETTNHVLRSKEGALEGLANAEEEALKTHKDLQRTRDMHAELEKLKKQMVWAQVKEREDERDEAEAKVAGLGRKVESVKRKEQEANAQLERLSVRMADLNGSLQAKKAAELEPLKVQLEEHKAKLHQADLERKDYIDQDREIYNQIKEVETKITAARRQLEVEQGRQAERDGGVRAGLEARLETLNASLAEKQAESVCTTDELRAIDGRIATARADTETLIDNLKQQTDRRDEARNQLYSLEQSKNNALRRFHARMPDLMRAIEAERRFKERPIGPFGLYIKPRKPQWVGVIEVVLGGTINAFAVTSHEDRALLNSLMQKCDCAGINILVGKRDIFDYSRGEPDGNLDTILRVLDIEDEFVKRQLIVNHQIESAVLIANRREADEFMYTQPPRVQSCYALNPDRPGHGYRVGGKRGASSTTPVVPRGPSRLTTDVDAEIAKARQSVQVLETTIQDLQIQVRQAEQAGRNLAREKHEMLMRLRAIKVDIQRAEDEADRIRDDLRVNTDTGRIQALEEQIAEFLTEKSIYQGQQQDLVQAMNRSKAVVEELRSEGAQIRAAIETIEEKLQETTTKLETVGGERIQASHDHNHWVQKLAQVRADLDAAQVALKKAVDLVESFTRDASGFCDRVDLPEDKDAKALDKEMEAKAQSIADTEKRVGMTAEDAEIQLNKARDTYAQAKKEVEALKELIQDLGLANQVRIERWKKFTKMISVRAKSMFQYMLSQRGFLGKLVVNHAEQKLELRVRPTENNQRNSKSREKDPRSLSGGEKSFSTVCLLLSLWEAMNCPIRGLDEFDVYMDAVNRKISMTMMVDAAKSQSNKQFILITPQDMGNVPDLMGRHVRVHRMMDPRIAANQRRLDDM